MKLSKLLDECENYGDTEIKKFRQKQQNENQGIQNIDIHNKNFISDNFSGHPSAPNPILSALFHC